MISVKSHRKINGHCYNKKQGFKAEREDLLSM
jgi:hypothetical protein